MATEQIAPVELPAAPKAVPLRITDEEQAYLAEVSRIAAETQATLEADQKFVNAKAAAEALVAARSDISKKYGMGNGDSVQRDGTIKRAAPRPGMPGQTQRPAQIQQ